jgi:hypothetical protein
MVLAITDPKRITIDPIARIIDSFSDEWDDLSFLWLITRCRLSGALMHYAHNLTIAVTGKIQA